jgi:hypothetical protein
MILLKDIKPVKEKKHGATFFFFTFLLWEVAAA